MRGTGSPALDRLFAATNDHDADRMRTCFQEDYRSEQPLHPQAGFTGPDQVVRNWSQMFDEIPDLRMDVLRSAVTGEEVWTELHVHGHTTDGSPFEYRGMAVWGVQDDLVAWARLYFETVEVGGPGIDERMQQVLGTDRPADDSA
jgi:ketosteroid isomerase-like protein